VKNYINALDAGYPIFPIHPVINGECQCELEYCDAAGKHPLSANWQLSPVWSEEQIAVMEDFGQLESGYGIVHAMAAWNHITNY